MYKLHYFPTRARGEQVRLLLEEVGAEYENVYIPRRELPKVQAQGPSVLAFASIPMLEEGGFRLVQGPVIMGYLARKHGLLAPTDLQRCAKADMMCLGAEDLRMTYFGLFGAGAEEKQAAFLQGRWSNRWLPRLDGLLELNGDNGFFAGDSLTHGDLAVFDALDAILKWVDGATFDGYERLQRFFNAIQERPRIAAYLASDRRLDV